MQFEPPQATVQSASAVQVPLSVPPPPPSPVSAAPPVVNGPRALATRRDASLQLENSMKNAMIALITDFEDEIEEYEALLQQKDQQIAALEAQLEAQLEQHLEKVALQTESSFVHVSSSSETLEKQVATLVQRLGFLEIQVNDQEKQVVDLAAQIEDSAAEIEDLQAVSERLEAEMEDQADSNEAMIRQLENRIDEL